MLKLCVSAISNCRFDKVMYSHDLTTIDFTKSCIHATYDKSRHYLTLMTGKCEPQWVQMIRSANTVAHAKFSGELGEIPEALCS